MASDAAWEHFILGVEEALGDTGLIIIDVKRLLVPRRGFKSGVYIHYRIYEADADRAIYLGDTLRTAKNTFDKWVRRWLVNV